MTQFIVDNTIMFPRYKPRDLLFLKRFFEPDYPFHQNADVVIFTSDGRTVIGTFRSHDATGFTVTQLSHERPVLIAQNRNPILYRVTGFAPCIPAQKAEQQHSAA
ncbi:hypothetical protein TH9_12350 [Thalassospira xiamenensis]|nr:hypothetical protein TH9_12350 [Thalassospira xiamenensis]